MNLETYKKQAAALRAHMEQPMKPFYQSTVRPNRGAAYLPGGEAKSMRVRQRPEDAEDLSHLNPGPWKKRKNGRKAKRG